MALCQKKVKDINPCSPTFGVVFTTLVNCPPPKKPSIPCFINILGVSILPAASQNCNC